MKCISAASVFLKNNIIILSAHNICGGIFTMNADIIWELFADTGNIGCYMLYTALRDDNGHC